jgi:hypothetical protein
MGMRAIGAMLLLGVIAILVEPAPAAASCVFPARTSAYAFVGTVTDTSNDGRVAAVRTDAGNVVTVVGTPDLGSGATSVDRKYVVGTRYEFHPINDKSPYQDNACTATHEVEGGPAPGGPGGSGGGWRWLAVASLALVAAAAIMVGIRRRAIRKPSSSS